MVYNLLMNGERQPANKRDFKGVFIPKEIWCNRDLNGDEKMLWGEVYALDNDFGCIASNEHFMEMFGFNNDRKPQRIIKSLKDKGYIKVDPEKRSNLRTITVIGKFRHLDGQEMENLHALKQGLIHKIKGN